MTARRVLPLAFLVLLLAACGQHATSGSGASDAPQSFTSFLTDVRSAGYQDFAGRPGAYLLDRYAKVHVVRSYTSGGAVFDCRTSAGATTAPGAACPAGSVPVRRTTLVDLTRFATLADFLGKAPGGTGGAPPAP
jgi:hypothetical protein